MRAEDNRLLCTIDEFARYLGYQLEYNDFGKYSFARRTREVKPYPHCWKKRLAGMVFAP